MPKGGARPNSGPRPHWKHGKTTTIRVPVVLSAQLLEIARHLDEGDSFELVSGSKEVEKVVSKEMAEGYVKDILVRLPIKDRKPALKVLSQLINKIYNRSQPSGDSSQATVE